MPSLSFSVFCVGICAWLGLRSIYRLYFHPLASIPGPKWAALTSMYGAYYDLPIETSYTRKIIELHDQYGPVVRILPNQVHVLDMKSYDEVFKTNSKFRRPDVPIYNNPLFDGSMWSTLDPADARVRRGIYLPFFSRQSIQQLEGLIHKQVLKFFAILEDKVKNSPSDPIDLTRGYKCVTADTIMEYCCMKSLGFLDAPNFNAPLIVALDAWFSNVPQAWYFPRLDRFMFTMVSKLPRAIIQKVAPVLIETMYIQKQNNGRVKELLAADEADLKKSGIRSLLENAISIRPKTGRVRLGEDELTSDVFILYAAGTDTTANTLAFGTWYLMNNPEARLKLKQELKDAMPDVRSDQLKSWSELEKLPYLTAVIKESLRLSFGAAHRLPRVSDSEHIVDGHRLPAGTIVCHSNSIFSLSEKYFKDAKKFIPERWLAADSRELEHNLVSFPRGPRSCIGQNLAWAELYICFAHMFRRFEIENAGTTSRGMEWLDYFVPYTREHLMVTLKLARD